MIIVNIYIIQIQKIKNEKDNRNNGGKIPYEKKTIPENTIDNTNDINRSLTPIRVDNNNSFITSFNDENNLEQNNKSLYVPNSNSMRKPDKILEMIRKEKSKKKLLDTDLKKIEN